MARIEREIADRLETKADSGTGPAQKLGARGWRPHPSPQSCSVKVGKTIHRQPVWRT